MRRAAQALCLLMLMVAPVRAADLHGVGVVFIHGKSTWAGAFDGGIPGSLEADGAVTAEPEMPWSIGRMYGATYEEAMQEIDAAVAGLKKKGATRIVIIGHSLGANAAIGYAARKRGIAAVVALSPGHLPETAEMRDRTADAIVTARALAAAGENSRRLWPDRIQGVPTFAMASPAVYLSMFDPDGPAVIPKNAAALKNVPLMWVVGRFDPIFSRGRDYAFSRVPKNPKNRYLEVLAGHLAAPMVARSEVVDWLESVVVTSNTGPMRGSR
ncbi:MAG: alpha/beta hydrolase [Bradyrhizobiaceae bacterium]|nr:alpha/beta hydrolase [Bradyrhizobiaceae bacterium]